MKNSLTNSNLKNIFLTIVASAFLFTSCQKEESILLNNEQTVDIIQEEVNSDVYVKNEVLLQFNQNISEESRKSILSKINGTVKEVIFTKTMERFNDNGGLYLVKTPLDVVAALNTLKGAPELEFIEPNYIYRTDAVSNDAGFLNGSMWGMYGTSTTPSNSFGCNATSAWANGNTGSNSVFIGIIDEGIQPNHEDLSANIWVNPYDPADGIDNDGNGYIDDVNGWNFDGNNNTTYIGTIDDHGTHVAGTIGAKGGNSVGAAGVCWDVKLISCRFLGSNGGSLVNAIKAIDYITDLRNRHGLNLPATNNSWGGGGYSSALKKAINRASLSNVLFIAAAGNSSLNNNSTPTYPASYNNSNIISVAAISSNGSLASFSNYGSTTVDIGAPGVSIYSTLPSFLGNYYGSYSGTSMAAPHVTGAAALYAAKFPYSSANNIKTAIMNSAIATTSLQSKCVSNGRLNVSNF